MPADETTKDELYSLIDQRLTPVRLTLDRVDRAVIQLEGVVYGDARTRQPGLIDRLTTLESKIDTLIDQGEARTNQLRGMKTAFTVLAAISSVPALQIVAKAIGALP